MSDDRMKAEFSQSQPSPIQRQEDDKEPETQEVEEQAQTAVYLGKTITLREGELTEVEARTPRPGGSSTEGTQTSLDDRTIKPQPFTYDMEKPLEVLGTGPKKKAGAEFPLREFKTSLVAPQLARAKQVRQIAQHYKFQQVLKTPEERAEFRQLLKELDDTITHLESANAKLQKLDETGPEFVDQMVKWLKDPATQNAAQASLQLASHPLLIDRFNEAEPLIRAELAVNDPTIHQASLLTLGMQIGTRFPMILEQAVKLCPEGKNKEELQALQGAYKGRCDQVNAATKEKQNAIVAKKNATLMLAGSAQKKYKPIRRLLAGIQLAQPRKDHSSLVQAANEVALALGSKASKQELRLKLDAFQELAKQGPVEVDETATDEPDGVESASHPLNESSLAGHRASPEARAASTEPEPQAPIRARDWKELDQLAKRAAKGFVNPKVAKEYLNAMASARRDYMTFAKLATTEEHVEFSKQAFDRLQLIAAQCEAHLEASKTYLDLRAKFHSETSALSMNPEEYQKMDDAIHRLGEKIRPLSAANPQNPGGLLRAISEAKTLAATVGKQEGLAANVQARGSILSKMVALLNQSPAQVLPFLTTHPRQSDGENAYKTILGDQAANPIYRHNLDRLREEISWTYTQVHQANKRFVAEGKPEKREGHVTKLAQGLSRALISLFKGRSGSSPLDPLESQFTTIIQRLAEEDLGPPA